jgi:hypothetical protein
MNNPLLQPALMGGFTQYDEEGYPLEHNEWDDVESKKNEEGGLFGGEDFDLKEEKLE